VLQYVVVCCSDSADERHSVDVAVCFSVSVYSNVLQCVAVCCSTPADERHSVDVAVYCIVLHSVAACCGVLQYSSR